MMITLPGSRRLFLSFMLVFVCSVSSVAFSQVNTQMLQALVLENQQSQSLPKPLLESMLEQGVKLEDAAKISVSNAVNATYAEAYTHYSICLAVSDRQAKDIYSIVTESAQPDVRPNVLVEASYTLDNYLSNRCESLALGSRKAPESNLSTENTVGARASISQ